MSRDFDTSSSTLADDQGRTPLLRACAGHGDGIQDTIAQLLLHQEEYGVDVNCRDAFQQTALVLVCLNSGDFASAEKLIQAGCDVNARDAFGRTALHICCDRGLNELAFLLLDNGADPHARTKEKGGDSPLLWAMRANNEDLCIKLLEGQHPNSLSVDELQVSKERFTSKNAREECPLSIACKESIQAIVHEAYRTVCTRLEELEQEMCKSAHSHPHQGGQEQKEEDRPSSSLSPVSSGPDRAKSQAFSNYRGSSQTTSSLNVAQAEQNSSAGKPPKKLKIKMKKKT